MSMSSATSLPSRAQRSSNIELLRIVAMLFVMCIHLWRDDAGMPSSQMLYANPLGTGVYLWFRMAILTGVDIFVLISGYFAIRPRVNSVASLFFQGLFYSVGMYAFWVLTRQNDFSLGELLMHLKPMKIYWFFGSYVWLMLLAPILNRYVETATRRELGLFLLAYYFLTCGMEWAFSASQQLERGFTTMAFVGLYLLGRYVRLHGGAGVSWLHDMIFWYSWGQRCSPLSSLLLSSGGWGIPWIQMMLWSLDWWVIPRLCVL